jgi:hypothetical protein
MPSGSFAPGSQALTSIKIPRVLSAFVNSFYSFYWDVAKDWDLSLFSATERIDPEYPFGLRRHRYFHAKEMYYGAIIIDFFLRFTWVFKLSSSLDRINDLESGIFVLMFLEVWRRWMWIFFRVETEWGEYFLIIFRISGSSPISELILTPLSNSSKQ